MLWFKNLMVYRLSRDIELRAEEMEKQLAELTFTPCGSRGYGENRLGVADGIAQRRADAYGKRPDHYLRA